MESGDADSFPFVVTVRIKIACLKKVIAIVIESNSCSFHLNYLNMKILIYVSVLDR